jgi:hypothetical protein
MIPYDSTIPFIEHFDMFRVPGNMSESVEQYRLDVLHSLMASLGVDYDFFSSLLNDSPSNLVFTSRFDPLAYFANTAMSHAGPGTAVTLPPVPFYLAEGEIILRPSVWDTPILPPGVLAADDKTVLVFSTLVAASMLDFDFVPKTRSTALRYVSINSIYHPASKALRLSPEEWQAHSREINIPDMVSRRLNDFVSLFEAHGQPLEPHELVCLNSQELASSAYNLRYYVVERNRHTAFCNACMDEMLRLNSLAAITSDHLQVF